MERLTSARLARHTRSCPESPREAKPVQNPSVVSALLARLSAPKLVREKPMEIEEPRVKVDRDLQQRAVERLSAARAKEPEDEEEEEDPLPVYKNPMEQKEVMAALSKPKDAFSGIVAVADLVPVDRMTRIECPRTPRHPVARATGSPYKAKLIVGASRAKRQPVPSELSDAEDELLAHLDSMIEEDDALISPEIRQGIEELLWSLLLVQRSTIEAPVLVRSKCREPIVKFRTIVYSQ